MSRAAETALAEWVAGRTVDDVLLNGKNEMGPDLVQRTQERIGDLPASACRCSSARDADRGPGRGEGGVRQRGPRADGDPHRCSTRPSRNAKATLRTAQGEKYRKEQETASYVYQPAGRWPRPRPNAFSTGCKQYEEGRKDNPDYLRQIWEEERGKLFAKLKENGQIGFARPSSRRRRPGPDHRPAAAEEAVSVTRNDSAGCPPAY